MEFISENIKNYNNFYGPHDPTLPVVKNAPEIAKRCDEEISNKNSFYSATSITNKISDLQPIFTTACNTPITTPSPYLKHFHDVFGKEAYGKTTDILKETYTNFNLDLLQPPRSSHCGVEQDAQVSTYSMPSWDLENSNDDFATDYFPNSNDSSRWTPLNHCSSNSNFFDSFKESSLLYRRFNEVSADECLESSSIFSNDEIGGGMNFPQPMIDSELPSTVANFGHREDEIDEETEKLHTPPPLSCNENSLTEKAAVIEPPLCFPKSKALEIPSNIPALKLARRLPPLTPCIPITSTIPEIPRCPLPLLINPARLPLPLFQSQNPQSPFIYSNFPFYPLYPVIPCQMLGSPLFPLNNIVQQAPPTESASQKKYVTVRELIEKKKRKKRNFGVVKEEIFFKEETFVKKMLLDTKSDVVTNIITTPVTSSLAVNTTVRQPDVGSTRKIPDHAGKSCDPNSTTTLLCLMPAVPNVPPDFGNVGNVPVVLTDFQKGKVNAKEHKPKHCEMKSLAIGTFKVEAVPSAKGTYRNKFKIVFSKRLFIYEFEYFFKPNEPKMICIEVSFQTLVAMRCIGRLLQLRVKKQPTMYEGLMKPRAGIVTQTPVYDKQRPIDLTDGQLSTHPVHRIMLKRSQSTRLRDVLIRFDPWFHAVFATPIGDEKCFLPLPPNAHAEWKITCQSLKKTQQFAEDNLPDTW